MADDAPVTSHQQALDIARRFAAQHEVNEGRVEAYADAWFDAGKDFDCSSADDLRAYLKRRFGLV